MSTFAKSNPIRQQIARDALADNGISTKREKDNPAMTADIKGVVEIVEKGERIVFLMEDGSVSDSITVDGTVFVPPQKENIAFDVVSYSDVMEMFEAMYQKNSEGSEDKEGSDGQKGVPPEKQLFQELIDYHYECSQLPDDDLYPIIAAWDFHTHLIEKFEFSPIISFVGLPEKGKSRMAGSMIQVSRRGIVKATINEAQLIREAQDQKATLFFDLKNFMQKIGQNNCEDLFLLRFQRGAKAARVLYPDRGSFKDMVYFSVFGPTLVASNELIDDVLDTRGFSIIMSDATREVKGINRKKAYNLKCKLTAWRLKNFNIELPEVKKILDNRLGDVMKTLHQVILITDPSYESKFIDTILRINNIKRKFRTDSIEAEILEIIISSTEFDAIGKIPVRHIVERYNFNKASRDTIAASVIGKRLSLMGFQRIRLTGGAAGIVQDSKLNLTLAKNYGLVEG